MIYRVLGGFSLLVGIIFLGVAFLALLPFLNNFNVTLLILAGVFFVLAWLFIAIGWQLANPPSPEGTGEVGEGEETEPEPVHAHAVDAEAAADATNPRPGGAEASSTEGTTGEAGAASGIADAPPSKVRLPEEGPHRAAHIQPEETFIGLGEADPTREEPPPESAPGNREGRRPGSIPAGRRFRKPGAALPPKEEPDR